MLADLYHLSVSSPCIGKGEYFYYSLFDIDGESWKEPSPIGCDEYYTGSITGNLSVALSASYTNVAKGFNVNFINNIIGHPAKSKYDFNDGSSLSNTPYASHSWNTTGIYDVVFTAFNDTYINGISATITVSVVDAPIYYVNINSTSPTIPFNSWSIAAINIQDAIDLATLPGSIILVSSGTYDTGNKLIHGNMRNRVAINKPIIVKSSNGPKTTIIKGTGPNGSGAIRSIYVGTNAVICGFTLTNGYTLTTGDTHKEKSGGGAWCESSATISKLFNSIIWYNSTSSGANNIQNAPITSYTCSPDVTHGVNNCITNEPMFTNITGNELNIKNGSLCLDAGFNGYVTSSTDLAGTTRIKNNTVDIGAYEGAINESFLIQKSIINIEEVIPLGQSLSNQSFEVWNFGSSNISYTISNSVSWISCTPTSGSSTGEHNTITIQFNTTGLTEGHHKGYIYIISSEASNSPQIITLNIYISPLLLDHFTWGQIPTPLNKNIPFNATIYAHNIENYLISNFSSDINIFASTYSPNETIFSACSGNNILNEHPMYVINNIERTQMIYLQNELGGPYKITSLSLNLTNAPALPLNNWTIRMKHTSLNDYETTANWEGDWTTVYQTNTTISSSGWTAFNFNTPFEYNGNDNLMIDLSFNNDSTSWSGNGRCMSSNTVISRVIFHSTSTGSPLDWDGSAGDPTPYTDTYIPEIQLGVLNLTNIAITPTNCLFNNGVCNSSITVQEVASNITMIAQSGSGKKGSSNPFYVIEGGIDYDSDNDGSTDNNEIIAGTDAYNSNSIFKVSYINNDINGAVINWVSVTGRVYSIYWLDNLLSSNDFQTLEYGITYPQNSYTDILHNITSQGYYRIGVKTQ